jgi:predicted nucleic acid-binding protein
MTAPRLLLDTSVVIEPPASGLAESHGGGALSTITIAELEFGVSATADPLLRSIRRDRIERLTATFDVLGFGLGTATHYGVLAAMLRAAGRNPRPRRLDLLIAASAVEHGLALATRNPDDFRHLERALTVIPVKD